MGVQRTVDNDIVLNYPFISFPQLQSTVQQYVIVNMIKT